MNLTCPHCQTANPAMAIFCQNCGSTLAAPTAQGRTVVATQSGVATLTPQDTQAIKNRVQNTFGVVPLDFTKNPINPTLANQREHTSFVNDISGSMSERYDGRYTKNKAAVRATGTMVLNKYQIDPDDMIGIVTFNHVAQIIQPLCLLRTHKREIIQTLQSLTSGGGTDINEGLKVAQELFDWNQNGIIRRIVLLTDGHGGHPLNTAEDLKSRGVVIDVIGVGENPSAVDEKLLRQVASTIEGEVRYRFIKDQQTLIRHYTQLAQKTATSA